jgi:hypothetical protein
MTVGEADDRGASAPALLLRVLGDADGDVCGDGFCAVPGTAAQEPAGTGPGE